MLCAAAAGMFIPVIIIRVLLPQVWTYICNHRYFIPALLFTAAAGVLTVVRSLDRETTSSYVLNISAADSGVPILSSVMMLTVVVCDVNDNPPVFVQSMYNVSILENQPPGFNVVTVSATDFDDLTSESIFTSICNLSCRLPWQHGSADHRSCHHSYSGNRYFVMQCSKKFVVQVFL